MISLGKFFNRKLLFCLDEMLLASSTLRSFRLTAAIVFVSPDTVEVTWTGDGGDRVLFGKWSGTEVKIDGQELLIMKESDLVGIIDEPAAKKKAA